MNVQITYMGSIVLDNTDNTLFYTNQLDRKQGDRDDAQEITAVWNHFQQNISKGRYAKDFITFF